jgi:hypothetical protein
MTFDRQFVKLKPGEEQFPGAPEGYRMELDSEFCERIKNPFMAAQIRDYADKLSKQQGLQPFMNMVIVAMLHHIADAIEGKDPPPWKEIKS